MSLTSCGTSPQSDHNIGTLSLMSAPKRPEYVLDFPPDTDKDYVAILVSIDDDPPHGTHHLLKGLPCDGASLLLCAYNMIRPN